MPSTWVLALASTDGPINRMMPASPTTPPARRLRVKVSSAKNRGASTTVRIGMVPNRMPAMPLSICCWPQAIVLKGIAPVSSPSQNSAIHPWRVRGRRTPKARIRPQQMGAAIRVRSAAEVSGEISLMAILTNRNIPPRSSAVVISRPQSARVIARFMAVSKVAYPQLTSPKGAGDNRRLQLRSSGPEFAQHRSAWSVDVRMSEKLLRFTGCGAGVGHKRHSLLALVGYRAGARGC